MRGVVCVNPFVELGTHLREGMEMRSRTIETTCPVEFLYFAAMRTPEVTTPGDRIIQYAGAKLGDLRGTCWLCGCATVHGFPVKKVIKPTFTDAGLAKTPWSDVICAHCAWALSYHKSFRNYSILATKAGLKHPSRAEVRDVLLCPPEPPFMLCVAESGQIWLHFKSKVNTVSAPFVVRFEHLDITVWPETFRIVLEWLEELYVVFSKKEIESGGYRQDRIREFGIERWETLETMIEPNRKSALFKLALFVAQREEEEKGKEGE